MATNRTVYHVVPNVSGTKWVITQEGKDATREEFRTKPEAVEAATHRARQHLPSQVKLHKSNGNMDYGSTYGDDPARSPS